jgi:tetratricopeptide (TPR) repeat protein
MHGPLSEISLIEVLQLLERGRRSGVLRVVGPDSREPRTVRIHRGRVTAVLPDAADTAIDRALVRRHLAPPDETEGALSSAERERLRERLARTALEAMMLWSRGRFDFTEADTEDGPLSWSADALVMALVDDESRRVERGEVLHDWHAIPALLPTEVMQIGDTLSLGALDWRILDTVDGQRDVAAISAALDEPLEDVGERVRGLVGGAILQLLVPQADGTAAARQAIDAGRYEEAAEHLRVRLHAAPNDAEAWRTLGLAEVGAGRFEAAVDAWVTWRRVAPERATEADALIVAARTMMEALLDHRE